MLVPMTSDDESLRSTNTAFYTAFARGDIAAMERLWSVDRPVACVHPGWAPLIGREAVMGSWQAILASPPPIRAGRAVTFLYGDTGFVLCREFLQDAVLAATNIYVREERHWRLVHHHAGPVQQVDINGDDEPVQRLH